LPVIVGHFNSNILIDRRAACFRVRTGRASTEWRDLMTLARGRQNACAGTPNAV
jgi:hypothetical protein